VGVNVAKKQYFKLNYWLKNPEGEVVDTSEGGEPMSFVEGSLKVIEGIQQAVSGRTTGERLDVTIPPELAYGPLRPEFVNSVAMSMFEGIDNVVPGMKFQTNTGKELQIVKVVEVNEEQVVIDANHPLAGLTLNFEIEIVECRDATLDELEAESSVG